jgi:hypothetical protein
MRLVMGLAQSGATVADGQARDSHPHTTTHRVWHHGAQSGIGRVHRRHGFL